MSYRPGQPSDELLARGPEWIIRHLFKWADNEFANPDVRDEVMNAIIDAIEEEIAAGSDWEFELDQGWRSWFDRLYPDGV